MEFIKTPGAAASTLLLWGTRRSSWVGLTVSVLSVLVACSRRCRRRRVNVVAAAAAAAVRGRAVRLSGGETRHGLSGGVG